MIKRTLYFGNPAYLKLKNAQLKIVLPAPKEALSEEFRSTTIPIEDIGIMVLDHQQITISQGLMAALLANNVALITCDNTYHPIGMLLNFEGNTLQAKRFRIQSEVALPLKKQLWAQTVSQKILNQAAVLKTIAPNPSEFLGFNAPRVKSGDSTNIEGQSAAIYWQNVFGADSGFNRSREGANPNLLLNYGYAILRASMARALVATGLHPTFGIHHRNQYNAYCLADDLMEPYRPYIDRLVLEIISKNEMFAELTKENKQDLLQVLTQDVYIGKEKSPLMVAIQTTAASLIQCYEGKRKKLLLPQIKN